MEVIMGRKQLKYLMILLVMLGGCNADFHTKKWANCNLKEVEYRQPSNK
jgi:hypothetical protein